MKEQIVEAIMDKVRISDFTNTNGQRVIDTSILKQILKDFKLYKHDDSINMTEEELQQELEYYNTPNEPEYNEDDCLSAVGDRLQDWIN